MVNLTEFIKLERHDPLITKLDEAVKRKKICTLLGPAGSGKTWLIDYWLRTSERLPEAVQSNQAVYIRLRPATETSLPMTCVVYSRIWHALRKLDRASYIQDDVRDEQELYNSEIKVYNSRQLQTLLLKVIEKASRKNIRVVVIDDAHHLDKTAVEWLLDLHTYYDEQRGLQPHRAIVLVGRDDKNLLSHLKNIEEARAAWNGFSLTLGHLTLAEFVTTLTWLTDKNLHANIAEGLDLRRAAIPLWYLAGGKVEKKDDGAIVEIAGGRWWEIAPIVEDIDIELGPWDGKTRRTMTQEILDRVIVRRRDLQE